MKRALGLAFGCLLSAAVYPAEPFLLKAGEGEEVGAGIVIKASPKNGTERSMMAEQTFQDFVTGAHIHDQGDELFYVVSGRGSALVGDSELPIGPGDTVFVPRGAKHKIGNDKYDEPLVVVFFMDTPELAETFRAVHHRLTSEPQREITAEEREEFLGLGGMRPAD